MADGLRHPTGAMADAVDRTYDRIAALDQLRDTVQAVFLSTVVVKELSYPRFSSRSQVWQQASASAKIQDAVPPQRLQLPRRSRPNAGDIDAAGIRLASWRMLHREAGNGGLGLARSYARRDQCALAFGEPAVQAADAAGPRDGRRFGATRQCRPGMRINGRSAGRVPLPQHLQASPPLPEQTSGHLAPLHIGLRHSVCPSGSS